MLSVYEYMPINLDDVCMLKHATMRTRIYTFHHAPYGYVISHHIFMVYQVQYSFNELKHFVRNSFSAMINNLFHKK